MSELEAKRIFAKNLNYYLNLNNEKQNEVAFKLGISVSTFSSWCTGQKMPRMGKIEMLANYFGIQKSDLIEEKKEKSPDESFYDYYTKARKSKGAVMFRGGDSGSDPFYMSAEEAADAEAYIRTRRKMQEEQGK